mmetsp:Transcript_41066/g.89663  ORF Transcript_41066/g.89663 Transcript_41066/m.89663 type:complete len:105 (-) Transcript_41066:70-384(-)
MRGACIIGSGRPPPPLPVGPSLLPLRLPHFPVRCSGTTGSRRRRIWGRRGRNSSRGGTSSSGSQRGSSGHPCSRGFHRGGGTVSKAQASEDGSGSRRRSEERTG